ncbi:hypothetical protein CDD81_3100 [Ophiocordyceps australis]|uniref:Uncharacterized protein n=1 Tax=Ophiocordyceps australis TaxID=1399860 RepID=A0A2C5YEE1_9HYPO|nr:hypothetical protein CDD81_3100 [Ophiocordyceps australis]
MFNLGKTVDIVSVFVKPNCAASARVAYLVKQASASLQDRATNGHATGHGLHYDVSEREPFEYNLTQEMPTTAQLHTIFSYVNRSDIPNIVHGAKNRNEALKIYKQSKDSFIRPLTVDWNNGKVVTGDNESEILRLVFRRPRK